MRVGVDARHVGSGRGVGRVTESLLAELRGVDLRLYRRAPRPVYAWMALAGRPRLGWDADVTWLPAPAPVAVRPPYVLTVHDLSWEQRPSDFTPYERAFHAAARPRILAEHAAAVVAPSHATAAAIRDRWGLDAVIVPNGVAAPPAAVGDCPLESLGLRSRPYLLCVGALEPRKDPLLLARAFGRARARGLDAQLVFAGTGRLRPEGPGVVRLGAVDDATLDALYRHARALVMPSLLEGFGLPPLEALVRGTPAVVSDLPVFRETLGDAATFVPAGDEAAWADALLRAGEHRPPPGFTPPTWRDAADRLREVLCSAS
jgi:glycosyltransferase involved in cell wall biosynthesis